MEIVIVIVALAFGALLLGPGPAEPPIYRIELMQPEQPAGRGQIWIALGLVVFLLLLLAGG